MGTGKRKKTGPQRRKRVREALRSAATVLRTALRGLAQAGSRREWCPQSVPVVVTRRRR